MWWLMGFEVQKIGEYHVLFKTLSHKWVTRWTVFVHFLVMILIPAAWHGRSISRKKNTCVGHTLTIVVIFRNRNNKIQQIWISIWMRCSARNEMKSSIETQFRYQFANRIWSDCELLICKQFDHNATGNLHQRCRHKHIEINIDCLPYGEIEIERPENLSKLIFYLNNHPRWVYATHTNWKEKFAAKLIYCENEWLNWMLFIIHILRCTIHLPQTHYIHYSSPLAHSGERYSVDEYNNSTTDVNIYIRRLCASSTTIECMSSSVRMCRRIHRFRWRYECDIGAYTPNEYCTLMNS